MTTRNRELASIIDADGNITAGGNLTVSGTTLTASSTVETHADPLIELNTGAGSNSNDLGFVFERGSTGNNACLIWDESNDGFVVGTTTATGTSTGNMSFTAGDFAAGKVTVDNVIINGTTIGHTSDTDLITLADGIATVAGEISVTTLDIGGTNVTSTAAELNILDGVNSTAAELNILDGVTATAAEINFLDGDTSATGTTLAAADRVIVNDAGTMKQVALSDFETFFESELDTFATIDINGGSIDGATVGANSASSGAFTTLTASSTLGIGGTNITATAAELNILDGVTTTAAELNIIDGDTSASSTTLVDADRVIVNDNGTMKQVTMSDVKTYNPGKTTEEIQDTVGAMFTSNTETRIGATYQDGDGTIDLVVDEVVRKILRVVARSAFVDCTVSDDAELTVTGRSGNVVVRRVSLPVQVIPQVTYR